ncbi:MAG: sialidase family protein [Bacillota bacterium]
MSKKKRDISGQAYYEAKVVDLTTIPDGCNEKYFYLYNQHVVDDNTVKAVVAGKITNYLGHPDTVLLDNGNLLTCYPEGHGRGATRIKISHDNGKTWPELVPNLPRTFKETKETPTIYKLNFVNGDQKLIIISGRPMWRGNKKEAQGFDAAVSTTKENGSCNGMEWEAHENFFGPHSGRRGYYAPAGTFSAVVAMASLTHLKEDGEFIDKWMGIFHDHKFNVYKTYLTFLKSGDMHWTYPTRLFDMNYRDREFAYNFCEPEVVRSPKGDELAILVRTNSKTICSHVSFSKDEGLTWSVPQRVSRELTGERHKAEYCPITGKLLITCRNIDWPLGEEYYADGFFSRGWVTWVGDYDDLKKGEDGHGDFLIKNAHTYLRGQTASTTMANSDTGYAGLAIDKTGMVISTSYGVFDASRKDTYVICKRFRLQDVVAVSGIELK